LVEEEEVFAGNATRGHESAREPEAEREQDLIGRAEADVDEPHEVAALVREDAEVEVLVEPRAAVAPRGQARQDDLDVARDLGPEARLHRLDEIVLELEALLVDEHVVDERPEDAFDPRDLGLELLAARETDLGALAAGASFGEARLDPRAPVARLAVAVLGRRQARARVLLGAERRAQDLALALERLADVLGRRRAALDRREERAEPALLLEDALRLGLGLEDLRERLHEGARALGHGAVLTGGSERVELDARASGVAGGVFDLLVERREVERVHVLGRGGGELLRLLVDRRVGELERALRGAE